MEQFVIKGNFCTSETADQIKILANRYLVVEGEKIAGIYEDLPEQFQNLPCQDYGDKLILPGMTDLHIHAPQFPFRGLGMDMELLDWLNTHTFPEESKYRDPDYAHDAYSVFTRRLRRSTTTRAVIFATVHNLATKILMDKMEGSGLVTYVGKVNMNRNCPDYIREASTEQSLADTEAWITHSLATYDRVKPILTPRFIPTCTDDLMRGLRELQVKYSLPVQSHLSENFGEIAWVRELCPWSKFYGDAYDQFGLFGKDYPCVMAHCVHSSPEEVALMKKNGVFIAHSPESNINLASGVAPIQTYLQEGLNVGLATDVAGGSHESLLRAMMHAIQASKLRWRLQDQNVKPLTFDQAFYLATRGGGKFFGQVGAFEPGFDFDAVVMDDTNLDHPQELSLRDRLERLTYLADDRNVFAKYVTGIRLF